MLNGTQNVIKSKAILVMGRKRSKIEWAMWANVLGLQAAFRTFWKKSLCMIFEASMGSPMAVVGLGGLLDQSRPFTSGNTFGAYAMYAAASRLLPSHNVIYIYRVAEP